jgi:hypothetical protein
MADSPTTSAAEVRHESSVVDARSVAWFSFGLAVMTVVSAVVAFLLLGGFRPPRPATTQLPPQAPGGTAILQAVPMSDLQAYRRAKDAELHSYGWVDRQAGWVQIPVDRAMALLAERAADHAPAKEQTP